eukprot:scpid51273/ scgid10682/ 
MKIKTRSKVVNKLRHLQEKHGSWKVLAIFKRYKTRTCTYPTKLKVVRVLLYMYMYSQQNMGTEEVGCVTERKEVSNSVNAEFWGCGASSQYAQSVTVSDFVSPQKLDLRLLGHFSSETEPTLRHHDCFTAASPFICSRQSVLAAVQTQDNHITGFPWLTKLIASADSKSLIVVHREPSKEWIIISATFEGRATFLCNTEEKRSANFDGTLNNTMTIAA